MECSGQGCTQKYKRKAEDCFAMFVSAVETLQSLQRLISRPQDDWADTLVHLRHTLPRKCPKCSAVTCVACGQPSTASAGKSPAAPYSPSDPLMHCVNIQPVVLGLGLFQLQKQFGQAPSADATSSSSKTGQKRKQSTPLSSEEEWSSEEEAAPPSYPGTPKSSKKAKGTGYGGQGHEDRSWQDKGAKAQKAQDEKMTALLKQVRPFLPSHWRETGEVTSDSMVSAARHLMDCSLSLLQPHPATLAHLRRRFGEIATTLLRNDALHEHADRADLFLEIQEWLIVSPYEEAIPEFSLNLLFCCRCRSSHVTKAWQRCSPCLTCGLQKSKCAKSMAARRLSPRTKQALASVNYLRASRSNASHTLWPGRPRRGEWTSKTRQIWPRARRLAIAWMPKRKRCSSMRKCACPMMECAAD